IIARYGGDEFTIVLPDTDGKEAVKIAENICVEVAELDILKSMKGPIRCITTSQGVAVFPQSGQTLKDLLETSDKALYRAKKEGRNRVIVAD
ncbi:MAG: hypothetical protein AMS17_04525, partial [Spirochaetes bacterium DG_61]